MFAYDISGRSFAGGGATGVQIKLPLIRAGLKPSATRSIEPMALEFGYILKAFPLMDF